jgi:hypothetical protein
LIAKIQAAEDPKLTDPFERKLRFLVADGVIDPTTARGLLKTHRETLRR